MVGSPLRTEEADGCLRLRDRVVSDYARYVYGFVRTQRYLLHAYDQMARGEAPDLAES